MFADAYDILEDDDFDRIDEDLDYIELELEETLEYDLNERHEPMWHDFDEINEDDLPN